MFLSNFHKTPRENVFLKGNYTYHLITYFWSWITLQIILH